MIRTIPTVSPVTAYSGGAWYVWSSGDVFGSDNVDLVDSYGLSPWTSGTGWAWYVRSSGDVVSGYGGIYVDSSYGCIISPGMLFRSMAFQAYLNGDVDYTFSNNIDLSYGKNIAGRDICKCMQCIS